MSRHSNLRNIISMVKFAGLRVPHFLTQSCGRSIRTRQFSCVQKFASGSITCLYVIEHYYKF